jgi:hypothetical protein
MNFESIAMRQTVWMRGQYTKVREIRRHKTGRLSPGSSAGLEFHFSTGRVTVRGGCYFEDAMARDARVFHLNEDRKVVSA